MSENDPTIEKLKLNKNVLDNFIETFSNLVGEDPEEFINYYNSLNVIHKEDYLTLVVLRIACSVLSNSSTNYIQKYLEKEEELDFEGFKTSLFRVISDFIYFSQADKKEGTTHKTYGAVLAIVMLQSLEVLPDEDIIKLFNKIVKNNKLKVKDIILSVENIFDMQSVIDFESEENKVIEDGIEYSKH